jgi:mannitol/fructose-specific phosphotransferase system IIA component
VVLGGTARDRDGAIDEVGALLVAAGAVEESYVAAMHAREAAVSTFMGNGLALPHGDAGSVAGVRRTAIALVRHEAPLDWGGEPVRFVVGLAGRGSEHLTLIGSLARVFTDDARIARLAAATTPAEVLAVLSED